MLTLTILLMVSTLSVPRQGKFFLKMLVAIALGFDLLSSFIASEIISEKLFTLSDIVYAVFLGVSIITLAHQLNETKKVDADILLGSISVYMLIGIFWFLLYRIAFILNPSNFNDLTINDDNDFLLLYFSFTTLTTVGYGDITPTASVAMGLSNMEAVMGQMYPAIFVSRLVSFYTTSLWEKHRQEEKED